jgi:RNA polymerase sigma factor (sigma-70 family)
MQELFIKLSSSRGLERADNPYAYAWKAATNLAFDWRRRQRVKQQPLEGDGYADKSEASALGRMVKAERVERILEATSRLSELARNAVIMRFIEQESYEEIALRLGKNPDHIRSLCSKSLARLREILVERDDTHMDKEASHG